VSIILAGYQKDIETELFSYNVGMASRFTTIPFDDFSESDLLLKWRSLCEEHDVQCDDKISVIAARRLARGMGRKGFGNARDARKLFQDAVSASDHRYFKEAKEGEKTEAGQGANRLHCPSGKEQLRT
jgi:hypothetical protein